MNFYEKEIVFYDRIAAKVNESIPIPDQIGGFQDPDDPATFFCLAMEDLNQEYEMMDQIKGSSFDDVLAIVEQAAGMHASFFESEMLSEPLLNNKNSNGESVPISCDPMVQAYLANPNGTAYVATVEAGTGVNYFEDPDNKAINDLFEFHGKRMIEELYKVWMSRPKTLIHGDMRGDNRFRHKTIPKKFKIIDWQSVTAGPPGIEFCQMVGCEIEPVKDYERLPEMLDKYMAKLHSQNPATKKYTREMLDFDIVAWICVFQVVVIPALLAQVLKESPPDSYIWTIYKPALLRALKCLRVLKAGPRMLKFAKDKGVI
eukprot:gnl/TRDRNA2_/TRDRNA2_137301_c0_seq1.p1 gnl/TRDRNA2_/TRDRNA2_137301_c0~~gnl/TRDRNA2_/TRDRNA2_137301_c0_seq1.p1  ORF type:complete len:341 (+),score=54.87 gnl/TRDRNA2_/TRDRNA2_137301_c0_seq1:76-1023(+)